MNVSLGLLYGIALALGGLAVGGDDLLQDRVSEHRVVGGLPVAAGDWPDAVALFDGDLFVCSGVLVASDVVLTAGHCADRVDGAVLNTVDYAAGGSEVGILKVIAYPQYWDTYDMALVQLEEKVQVPPRLVAMDCVIDNWLVDGAEVAIVGYGATDALGSGSSTVLTEARTQVVDPDCVGEDVGCHGSVSPGGELVAGGEGADSCDGDSGGPLYLLTADGDFLVGITSRSVLTATVPCGDGGIYTRPDALVDWIEQESGRVLVSPSCEEFNHRPEPSPIELDVEAGQTVWVHLDPNDPDANDHHEWTVVASPDSGTVDIGDNGTMSYRADEDGSGRDQVVLEVSDDGVPVLVGTLTVELDVVRTSEGGGGCAAMPMTLGSWGFAVLALIRRRR